MTKHHDLTKKVFSLLLSLTMVLTMMPMTVWADGEPDEFDAVTAAEAVAQIGETGTGLTSNEETVAAVRSGDVTQNYPTFAEAWAAAKDGDTITLMKDAETDTINFTGGTRTIDLGGHTLTSSAEVIKINGGTLTVKNGTLSSNGTSDHAVKIGDDYGNGNGNLTLEDASIKGGNYSIDHNSGNLSIYGNGEYKRTVYITPNKGTVKFSGGSYLTIINYKGDNYADLLEDGYIFKSISTGNYLSPSEVKNLKVPVRVVLCTSHDPNEDNICKRCGVSHKHNFGENGKCETCGVQMEAKCGDTLYSTLEEAINAAAAGSTVTLLKEEVSSTYTYKKGYAITIDLNGNKWISASTPLTIESGHVTLQNGMVWGGKNNSGAGISVAASAQLTLGTKMIVKGTGGSITGSSRNYNQAIVLKSGSKLELAEDSVILGGLDLYHTIIPDNILPENTAFVRCTYDETTGKVTIPGADDGKYEFIQEAHKSTYYIDGDMAVVSHTHDFGTGGTCVCGLITAAEVNGTLYRTITEAIEAAGENGTVKLMASEVGVGETITIDKPLTIDLNGKTLKGSVTVVSTLNLTDSRTDSTTKGVADSITLGNGTTDGSLQILDGKVLVTTLTVNNKGKSPLTTMGWYNNIVCNGEITLAGLLPNPVDNEYYAFKSTYAGKFLSCTESEINQATGIYIHLEACTHEWNNSVCNYCNYQCVDHKFNENGICERCGTQTAALLYKDGEFVNGYKSLTEAFTAINDAAKSEPNMKLLLMADNSMKQTLTASGNWTLDLNSRSLSNTTINVNGNLTINRLAQGIQAVTVKSGAKLTIPVNQEIGRIENLTIENGGKAELSSGIYGSITNENAGGKLANLLADGYAFADSSQTDDRTIIDGYTPNNRTNLKVVAHTHNMGEDNKCACGLICNHEQHTNGQCIKCGIPYAHTSEELTEDGGAYTCSKCNQQMAVKVEKDNNTTYYAKRHETRYPYAEDTLKQVFNKAADGSTITLLEDNLFASGGVIGKNITLDLNGKNLIENNGIIVESEDNATGKLTVTGRGSSTIPEDSRYTCTFRVSSDGELLFDEDFSGKFGTIYVEGGELSSDSTNMTFDALKIQSSGATVSLKGGTFGTITCSGSKTLGDLLAKNSGKAFKYTGEGGEFVPYDTEIIGENAVENVTITDCEHDSVTNSACDYCGMKNIVAICTTGSNSTSYCAEDDSDTARNAAAQKAFNAIKNCDGTLKLFADVKISYISFGVSQGSAEGTSISQTVDLNGHTVTNENLSGLNVQELVTLTIKDSSKNKTGSFGYISVHEGGKLVVESGTIGTVALSSGSDMKITGGAFDSIRSYDYSKKLIDFLQDGQAFADTNSGNVVDGYVDTLENVKVVSHTSHDFKSGKNYACVCGKPCEHVKGYSGGNCPDCGAPCPHDEKNVREVKGVYTCGDCGKTMTVHVAHSDVSVKPRTPNEHENSRCVSYWY